MYGTCTRPCTRHVYGRVHGPSCTWQVGLPGHVHVPRRHATAVCGPLRHTVRVHCPCTRRHVDTCTQPYTCRVHGRVHGPYTAVYKSRVRAVYVPCTCTFHVHGRRRPCRRPVHSHVHGWCRRAVCTAHRRLCTGRVYGTAVIRPCTGRFRGRRRVHGPCTRPPCNGHTTRYTAVYTAVYTTRYTAVYTARTRTQNGRLHGRGRPVHGRVTAV